jgi:hypothetical protein
MVAKRRIPRRPTRYSDAGHERQIGASRLDRRTDRVLRCPNAPIAVIFLD